MELEQKSPKKISQANIGFDFFNKFKSKIIIVSCLIVILNLILTNLAAIYLLKVIEPILLIIINSLIIALSCLEIFFLTNFILKPFRQILDSLFPFAQVNRSLSKDFNQKQNFDEIIRVIYYLKSLKLKGSEIELTETQNLDYFKQIKIGIIVFNPQKQIVYHNDYANQFINKGKLTFDYQLNNLTIEDWIDSCQRTSVHASYAWDELSLNDQQNQKHWYHVIADFQKGSTAETTVFVSDRTDLYKQKQTEFDFISFAAHELRGPITVIRGYLDILKNDQKAQLSEESKTIVDRLTVSGNRLSSYVTNILNVAKFDQKHLKLVIGEQKIESIFQEIFDDVNLRAKTQNRILSFQAEPNLPTIACDKSSLSQVFTNLIDNAIKYSNQGGKINVRAYKKGNYVNVEVIDHGIGMPANVVANLFKRFYRSQRSKDSVSGTGIGLFISKAIIDSHGGYITVDSTYGEGSTFTVGVPMFNQVTSSDNQQILESRPNTSIKNHGRFSE